MNTKPGSPGPNALLVRPAQAGDLPTLAAWLGRAVPAPAAPAELLLLAETGGTLQACLRLVPAIGMVLPRVSYHVGVVVHAARELGLFQPQRTLLLGHDHTGSSELADLGLAPGLGDGARAAAFDALLAAALARIEARPGDYARRLVVELPGLRDDDGRSPFWEGLGRHFYPGDPAAAAARHGPEWRCHVAELLPRQVVHTSFLPPAAQHALGAVHPNWRSLLPLLQAAGFADSEHVNVEDGGPIFARPLG